jgi:hypothetical protein
MAATLPELEMARGEYGRALRELRLIEREVRGLKHAPPDALLRRHGQAQDAVARAAARLSEVTRGSAPRSSGNGHHKDKS